MKKLPNDARQRTRRRNLRDRRNGDRRSSRARRRALGRRPQSSLEREYAAIRRRRAKIRRQIYSKKRYTGRPEEFRIATELGIEEPATVDSFIEAAVKLIDFNSRALSIDFSDCPRVWPSGVTLLCSLARWVDLTSVGPRRPEIRSTRPRNDDVHLYLHHCGFYRFVDIEGADSVPVGAPFADERVVKIQRETSPSNIEAREDQIVTLMRNQSGFTDEEIELFDAKVLTEVFNNVTEHGVARKGEQGWWVLAQFHPRHRLISLCIADNGIGLRNTLLTGPQRDDILQRVGRGSGDGEFIRLALEEGVSGALDAPQKTERRLQSRLTGGMITTIYPRGSHRGNGLKRIRETCQKLRIPFSITSHMGYAQVAASGAIDRVISRSRRVVGGAMYHFSIPSKGA